MNRVPADSRLSKPIQILLVDDDPNDQETFQEAIEALDIPTKVTIARDGRAAVEELASPSPLPDLILLDINMPGMDGHATLEHIKTNESLQAIPVIMLTTSDADDDIRKAYMAHANSFITKPQDLDDVDRVTKELRDYWLATAEIPPRQ